MLCEPYSTSKRRIRNIIQGTSEVDPDILHQQKGVSVKHAPQPFKSEVVITLHCYTVL